MTMYAQARMDATSLFKSWEFMLDQICQNFMSLEGKKKKKKV